MRGNHDNGMCFQTMQLIAVAVAMVFVLCVTAGTIGALAMAVICCKAALQRS